MPNESLKGDNARSTSNPSDTNSSPHPAYLRTGRPLRRAATKSTYVDSDDTDSVMSDDVLKVCNKTNPSKPSASGPSATWMAEQNKRTLSPIFGVKPNKVYKCSSSPTYSISSSGASICCSEHNDSDSDATFD